MFEKKSFVKLVLWWVAPCYVCDCQFLWSWKSVILRKIKNYINSKIILYYNNSNWLYYEIWNTSYLKFWILILDITWEILSSGIKSFRKYDISQNVLDFQKILNFPNFSFFSRVWYFSCFLARICNGMLLNYRILLFPCNTETILHINTKSNSPINANPEPDFDART